MPASAARAARRIRSQRVCRLRGHLRQPRRSLRVRRHVRRPPPARRAAARLRSALRPRDLVRGIVHRHRDHDPDSARGDVRDAAAARARRPAAPPEDVRAVPGLGPAALPAGIPDRRAPLLELPRHRQGHQQAVPGVPRRGTRRPRAQDHREDSRRASPPASACGSTARASTASAGGPPGDLYVVVHVQEHHVLPSRGGRSLLRAARHLPDAGAGRRVAGADDERRRGGQGAGRHAAGRAVQASRQGHAERRRAAATATST